MGVMVMRRAQSLLLFEQTMNNASAAGTCVIADSLLLMLQRGPKGAAPLTWAFAGGRIEEGETPFQAAIRETQEELSVDLRYDPVAFSFSQPIPGEAGKTFTTFVYTFPRVPSGWSPRINEESLAFGWFTLPAVKMLNLHPGIPYALKQIGWGKY